MSINKTVAVVHLVWMPLGLEPFYSFINSYIQNSPGYPHELVLVFNGIQNQSDAYLHHEYAQQQNLIYTSLYSESGQDLDIYFWAATKIESEAIVFLNSFSIIKYDNWLSKYSKNFFSDNCGIISATASYQSHYSSVFQNHKWGYEKNKGRQYNYRKYKLFIKALFYWRFLFKPFPNPHIRTNAFMLDRSVFLSLKSPLLKSKMDAYCFESGRNSLTNQIINKGLKALVIDKDGNTYESNEWQTSKTFWISNQENLIISDNQTRAYDNGSIEQKKIMTLSAWGIYA